MTGAPRDDFAEQVAAQGDDPAFVAILEDVCRLTHMGFAAIARVTEQRWIACHVLDKIGFGVDPGDELEIKTTICNDIRECGRAIVIDHVADDPAWRTHHTPMLYGFESYASFPIILDDDSFYGTLCAIDPEPRTVSAPKVIAALESHARKVADILSVKMRA